MLGSRCEDFSPLKMKVRAPTIEVLLSVACDRGPALRIFVVQVSISRPPQVAIPGLCPGGLRTPRNAVLFVPLVKTYCIDPDQLMLFDLKVLCSVHLNSYLAYFPLPTIL